MGPGSNAIYLLQHVSSVIGRQTEEVIKSNLGIGSSQFRILMVLEWNPRASQRSIADSLGQTAASISRQAKVMEKAGLITAGPAPGNRRRQILAPTPKGMQVTEAANDVLKRHLEKELSSLPQERRTRFLEDLHKLHRGVCRPGQPGACDHQLGF